MSTRGAIARRTGVGEFRGVYHHYDGYPEGLGRTLFHAYRGHFQRDLSAMLKYLIDDHPAGWSSINGADWDMPATSDPLDSNDSLCICGLETWRHYRQYYAEWADHAGEPLPDPSLVHPDNPVFVLGHGVVRPDPPLPHGPHCYAGDNPLNQSNTAGCGVEYVYAFEHRDGLDRMLILSAYRVDGQKMIGMFGCGDPNSVWVPVADIDLNGPEPFWADIESRKGVVLT